MGVFIVWFVVSLSAGYVGVADPLLRLLYLLMYPSVMCEYEVESHYLAFEDAHTQV